MSAAMAPRFVSRKPELRTIPSTPLPQPVRRKHELQLVPKRRDDYQKPAPQNTVAMRGCLRCRRAFRSTHIGNRLCEPCRNYAAGIAL